MDDIDLVRQFNRFYLARLGVLGRGYLGSDLTTAEARILHDLAQEAPPQARDLATTLALDEAQVSRTLKRFEARGWLERRVSSEDARRRDIRLTEAGQRIAGTLIDRSRDAIAQMLDDLDPDDRTILVESLGSALRLLAGDKGCWELRDLRPGDAGWIISRHGALYAQDEGFDATFEALVADILAAFLRDHDPGRERGWIAMRGGARVGSIFLVSAGPETAKLRLFFVERTERGTGLAQAMLEACMDFARRAGYRRMVLWTHESHRAAGRLYQRNGFVLTQSKTARSFGQDVIEQSWERALED